MVLPSLQGLPLLQTHSVGTPLSALLQALQLSNFGACAVRIYGIGIRSVDAAPSGGVWDPTVGGIC